MFQWGSELRYLCYQKRIDDENHFIVMLLLEPVLRLISGGKEFAVLKLLPNWQSFDYKLQFDVIVFEDKLNMHGLKKILVQCFIYSN